MKSSTRTLMLVAIGALLGATPSVAQKSDLTSPKQREVAVELADKLVEPRVLAEETAQLVVPFNPAGFDRSNEKTKVDPANVNTSAPPAGDLSILTALAEKLAPSGVAIIGGDPILLFGQKRIRVGDHLTVTYEGADYDLEITAIARTTFTLRLNREEITRPIKPGKKP